MTDFCTTDCEIFLKYLQNLATQINESFADELTLKFTCLTEL